MLSFRARQLDVSKPMPIHMPQDPSDLATASEIKRAVPQMPTGMERNEECERHLQQAIVTGTVIPTPEVNELEDFQVYRKIYPGGYRRPKHLIHMHLSASEQRNTEYNADSEDELWLNSDDNALNIDIEKFESIIDELDTSSNFSVITLPESKSLVDENEDVVTAVYDYWLSKRLRFQHSLTPKVKTAIGASATDDAYVAFRRRWDKMQTRRNRKNDEFSYETMLKLKEDLSRVRTLFQMLQKRERLKWQLTRLQMEIYRKRYDGRDFDGIMLNEVKNLQPPPTQYSSLNAVAVTDDNYRTFSSICKANVLKKTSPQSFHTDNENRNSTNMKRKRNHALNNNFDSSILVTSHQNSSPRAFANADENPFSFKRQKNCAYLAPTNDQWLWDYDVDEMCGDKNRRFYSAYVSIPRLKDVGFVRRRLGRGGRVLLDRTGYMLEEMWSKLDYTITESDPMAEFAKYKPKSPSSTSSNESYYESDESIDYAKPLLEIGSGDGRKTCIEIDLNSPLQKDSTYVMLDRLISCMDSGGAKTAPRITLTDTIKMDSFEYETNDSIVNRQMRAKKNQPTTMRTVDDRFYLSTDYNTIGCSTFKTSTTSFLK